jgi:hypothetical protein
MRDSVEYRVIIGNSAKTTALIHGDSTSSSQARRKTTNAAAPPKALRVNERAERSNLRPGERIAEPNILTARPRNFEGLR